MDKILLLLACLPVAAPLPLPDRAPAPWTFVVTTVAGELFARLRTTDNLLHHIYFTNSREISVYFFLPPHVSPRACLSYRPAQIQLDPFPLCQGNGSETSTNGVCVCV